MGLSLSGGASDKSIASRVSDPKSATRAALANTFAQTITPPKIANLIAGQADETFAATNCTITADTTNVRLGTQSWKITTAADATAIAKTTTLPTGTHVDPNMAAHGVWVYVEDATKITTIAVDLYSDVTDSNYRSANPANLRGGLAANLKTGWNYWRFVRFNMSSPIGAPTWGTVHHLRLFYVCNAATSVSLQAVTAEHRDKASVVFIHDGGYTAFDQSPGYHDLRDRGVPVTWSVDCALIGDATHVTRDRLIAIGNENGNSISFHGWDPTTAASSGFTAAQARAETAKCQKWIGALPTRGSTGRMFRTAWYQNNAPQSAATDAMVLANPMYDGTVKATPDAWPLTDRFSFYRHSLHGQSAGANAAMFQQLQDRRGVLFVYTHNVSNTGASNVTLADWAEFLSLVDAGIAAGWLECTTLEQLMAASGVTVQQGMTGAWRVEWPEIDGTTTVRNIL